MKVTALVGVRYKKARRNPGEVFDISEKDYELHKNLLRPVEVPRPADEDTGLSAMTVALLRDLAKVKGIEGFSGMKKQELIAALEGAEANGRSDDPTDQA